MTENSYFWDGYTTGHAVTAPYSANEFRNVWRTILIRDRNDQGLIAGVGSYCEAIKMSFVGGGNIWFEDGNAMIEGNFYQYDGGSFPYTLPSTGFYYYTLVLRQNKAAKTVRLEMLGPSSSSYPTPTQTTDIWEIVVGRFKFSSSTVVQWNEPSRKVSANDGGVIISSWRRGGSSSNWSTAGTTNYEMDRQARIQAGVKRWTGSNSAGYVDVTFPVAFENVPLIIACPRNVTTSPGYGIEHIFTNVDLLTSSSCRIYWGNPLGTLYTLVDLNWMAIGPLPVS